MKALLSFVLVLLQLNLVAQTLSTNNKKAQKFYEQANQYISINQFDSAAGELKKAVSEDPKFVEAFYLLGDVYRKLQNFAAAKENYRRVEDLKPGLDANLYFNLGESELRTGEYSASLNHLQQYSLQENLSETRKSVLKKYLADAGFGIEAVKNKVSFVPVNAGEAVNSTADEYLPVVTADESLLIFTRKSNNNEDFYSSRKHGGSWQKARFLSPNINTTVYNEGAQCLSPDGKYLFFTGCNRPDGKGRCDIYVCHREGNDWSKPFNLGSPVNGNTWESQPSISADGRTLYFVSSRPGGFGGIDIWKASLLDNGDWSAPENLGAQINTAFDEESVFIHPDGKTLYFSSKGWPGLGGRDLFMSRLNESGKWQQPVNLGYPINTYKDEGGLTISTDGTTAYFSSDQAGGFGGMDIYSFKLSDRIKPSPVTWIAGNVFDADTKLPLNASISITSVESNRSVYEDSAEEGKFLSTMPSGDNYALEAEAAGYLFYSANFSLKKPSSYEKPYMLDIALKPITIGASGILNNIFFESNRFELLPQSKAELQQLIRFMTQNPSVAIEIGGHTDNIGEDKANQILSENRAKAVFNYLITQHIAANRLSFKGYGEGKPIADNSSENGRQLNRRTEFKIVSK